MKIMTIKRDGVAVALHKGSWHFLRFTDPPLMGILKDQMLVGSMVVDLQYMDVLDWSPCPPEHPMWLCFKEQLDRPVQRVGRLVDILVEGEPAIVESPLGRTISYFDGRRFAIEVPLDESVLFDRGWKVRSGHRPLKLIECST